MSEPIRILHMIGSLNVGGSQSLIINLYKNIDRTKYQFDFVIDKPNETYYKNLIESMGGKIYVMPSFNGINFSQIRKSWKEFLLSHREYKILHSHVRSYASIYLPVAKKCGVKTIVHSHSTSNGSGIKSFAKKVLQYPLRFVSDYYFACSKESAKWLFGNRVSKSSKCVVLKNAINTEQYLLDEKIRSEYRNQLHIHNNLVYLHVGRLHESKNHMFLLDVFGALHKMNDETKLLIVGDGDLKEKIQNKICDLKLSDSVFLLGNRDDVPQLMMASDCFLFPSNWEGLPVTVVEAQASGLECFISDRITKEVQVSDLVHYLSIDNGIDIWIDSLKGFKYQKKDVREYIIDSGFDVRSTSNLLCDFYQRIVND